MTGTTLVRRFAAGVLAMWAVVSATAFAQGSLTLRAAIDQAMAANAMIAAARLRGPINVAELAVASERLNPEGTVEFEKEAPKQAYGVAVPLQLGGKRARRIAVSQATLRLGDAELA